MKKKYLLIVVILAGFAFESFATMQTTGWRWRNDDGNEVNATWIAGDTVAVTIGPNQVVRLRVRYDNIWGEGNDLMVRGLGYADKETIDQLLADFPFRDNPLDTDEFAVYGNNENFTPLGPDGYFEFASSEYVAHQALTTDQSIVFGSKDVGEEQTTFLDGLFMSDTVDFTLFPEMYTEIEYCIKATANCVNGTYYFMGGGGQSIIFPGDTKYEKYPELTVDMSIVGVQEKEREEIKIFASEGNIKIFSLPQGNVSISLYNLAGSMVKKLETNNNGEVINIPVDNLSQGLYIVKVQSAEVNYSKKFIYN